MTNFNFLLRKAWIKEIHLEKQHRMGSIKKKRLETLMINAATLWEEKESIQDLLKQLRLKMLLRTSKRTRTVNESFKKQRNMINCGTLDNHN